MWGVVWKGRCGEGVEVTVGTWVARVFGELASIRRRGWVLDVLEGGGGVRVGRTAQVVLVTGIVGTGRVLKCRVCVKDIVWMRRWEKEEEEWRKRERRGGEEAEEEE